MHQNSVTSDSAGAITRYFAKANLPTQQETLGEIVTEILEDILAILEFSPSIAAEVRPHLKKFRIPPSCFCKVLAKVSKAARPLEAANSTHWQSLLAVSAMEVCV